MFMDWPTAEDEAFDATDFVSRISPYQNIPCGSNILPLDRCFQKNPDFSLRGVSRAHGEAEVWTASLTGSTGQLAEIKEWLDTSGARIVHSSPVPLSTPLSELRVPLLSMPLSPSHCLSSPPGRACAASGARSVSANPRCRLGGRGP